MFQSFSPDHAASRRGIWSLLETAPDTSRQEVRFWECKGTIFLLFLNNAEAINFGYPWKYFWRCFSLFRCCRPQRSVKSQVPFLRWWTGRSGRAGPRLRSGQARSCSRRRHFSSTALWRAEGGRGCRWLCSWWGRSRAGAWHWMCRGVRWHRWAGWRRHTGRGSAGRWGAGRRRLLQGRGWRCGSGRSLRWGRWRRRWC